MFTLYFFIFVLVLVVGSAVAWALLEYLKRRPTEDPERKVRIVLAALNQRILRGTADASVYTKRGIIRCKRRDHQEAVTDFDRAIELDNGHTEAYYHRAVARQEIGDFIGAEKDFCWIRDYSEDPFYKTAVRQRLPELRSRKSR